MSAEKLLLSGFSTKSAQISVNFLARGALPLRGLCRKTKRPIQNLSSTRFLKSRRSEEMLEELESSIEADLAAADSGRQALDHVLDRLISWRRYYWLGVYRIEGKIVKSLAFRGPDPACGDFIVGKGNVGTAAQTGAPRNIPDVAQDPFYQQCFSNVKSELVLPITAVEESGQRRIVGVMDVESDEKDFFTEVDEEVLGFVCAQLAPILSGVE
jgi:putative methionine-R-sulfoxide reductase with GAF domain